MLSVSEYNLLMKAVELKNVDIEYYIHLLAFNNLRVRAEKKIGKDKVKPVYDTFKKFFNYDERLNEVLGRKKSKFENLKNFLKAKKGGNSDA